MKENVEKSNYNKKGSKCLFKNCLLNSTSSGWIPYTWRESIWGLSRRYPAMYYEKYRHLVKKKQETLYIGQWCLSPFQSRHLGTSHSSPNLHQLPHCIFLNLINGLKSLPFQRWFSFWVKPEVAGHQIWAVGGLSHLGDLMFCQKILHKTWCMRGSIVVMKLLITSCP